MLAADKILGIFHADTIDAAENQALYFSAILAADKGYSSTIEPIDGGFDVVASDGRGCRFLTR